MVECLPSMPKALGLIPVQGEKVASSFPLVLGDQGTEYGASGGLHKAIPSEGAPFIS
jgi:hypothetical protein